MKQVTCFNLTETQLVKVSFRPAFWQSVVKQAFQSSIKKAVPRDGKMRSVKLINTVLSKLKQREMLDGLFSITQENEKFYFDDGKLNI